MLQNLKGNDLWPIIVVLVVGFWVFLPGMLYGPVESGDSIAFTSTAFNLALGKGFLAYDGRPFSNWPPLYPSLLALFLKIGLPIPVAGFLLNAGSFLLTGFLLNHFLVKLEINQPIKIGGLIFSLASLYSIIPFTILVSEGLYIAFTLLLLSLLIQFIEKPIKTFFWYLLLAVWVCSLQRYSGVYLIGFVCLIILFFSKRPLRGRIEDSFSFGILAGIPLAAWLLRNYLVTDSLSGADRTVELKYIQYNIVNAIQQLWEWFFPYFQTAGFVYFAAICLLFLVLLFGVLIKKHLQKYSSSFLLVLVLTGHTVGYLLFILTTAFLQSSGALEPRLIAPAYFTAIPLVCLGLQSFFNHIDSRFLKTMILVLIASSILFSSYRAYSFWQAEMTNSVGYNSVQGKHSGILHFLKSKEGQKVLQKANLYTNGPEALYFHGVGYIHNVLQEHRIGILHKDFKADKALKTVIWYGDLRNFNSLMKGNGYINYFKPIRKFNDGFVLEEQYTP